LSQLSRDKFKPSVSQTKISGILLAAGEASRMGCQKLLLPWRGTTILESIVDSYVHSKIFELNVVVNPDNPQIKKALMMKPIVIVENPDYKEGMSTSIRQGIEATSAQADGYLIGLGDQPLITTDIIDHLVSSFSKECPGIVICSHQGKRGHPVIFARKFRRALLALERDKGGQMIIKQHSDEIQQVESGSKSIFMDIDTPEDYEKILKVDFQKAGDYL